MQYFQAHKPALDELVAVLREGLKAHFETVDVDIVDCPDFSQRPYEISVSGLNGKPMIADVGGGE